MNDTISIILSDNFKNHIPLLMNILEEYGIKQQKRVYMQAFLFNSSYYVNRLISLASKIDFKLVESYMFPIGAKQKAFVQKKIDYNKFLLALEKIRHSKIVMSSHKIFHEDWLDYIFDKTTIEPYDVIIIDDFDRLLKESNKDRKTIKKIIEEYSKKRNTEIILFTKDKRVKKDFLDWKFARVNEPLKFVFDKKNYTIKDIS